MPHRVADVKSLHPFSTCGKAGTSVQLRLWYQARRRHRRATPRSRFHDFQVRTLQPADPRRGSEDIGPFRGSGDWKRPWLRGPAAELGDDFTVLLRQLDPPGATVSALFRTD